MKLLGLLFGLDPELASKGRGARRVLLQGVRPPAMHRIKAHQGAMGALLQGLEPQRVEGGLDRSIDAPRCRLQLGEPFETFPDEFLQPCPFGRDPLVEGG